jgi:hypothetical protein
MQFITCVVFDSIKTMNLKNENIDNRKNQCSGSGGVLSFRAPRIRIRQLKLEVPDPGPSIIKQK